MTTRNERPRLVAFASGKGGTGKTLLAANLGIYLATLGKRVMVIDAALGSANLHMFLGDIRAQRTLGEAFSREAPHLSELVEATPVPGLQIVSGERDPTWVANPRTSQVKRLGSQIAELDADIAILDLGSGTRGYVLDLFSQAHVGVLVATPDPASVELCYRFVRAAFLRMLGQAGIGELSRVPPEEIREFEGGMLSPRDIYERAVERDHGVADRVAAHIAAFCPHLVMNLARSKADMTLGDEIAAAARRRLGCAVAYLGHTEYDEAAWVAHRRRRPLLVDHPESRASKCVEKLARRIIAYEPTKTDLSGLLRPEETFYDLFEVAPTASFEDIRRANRRVREVYAHDSIVVAGLYTPKRLQQLHARFDEAYRTLMDAAKRKDYDQELFPDGIPAGMLSPVTPTLPPVPAVERPPMPDIPVDAVFTGALLRRIREAKGTSLREVAERSKVGMTYLRAIETETFEKLPAAVYVRGFLAEYCKIVGLDGERVLETYLERYRGAREHLEE